VVALPNALPAPAGESAGTVEINYAGVQQVVYGLGFSTAWGSLPGSDANSDAFLSVSKGAGFSILRNRIPFRERPNADDKFMAKEGGAYTYTTVTDAQGTYKNFNLQWNNWDLAKTRDLLAKAKLNPDYRLTKVFSTPWTPPNNAIDRWKLPTDPSSKARHRLTDASYATKPDSGGYLDPAHYQDYADVLADYVLGFKANMGSDLYALSLQNEPSYDVDYESCEWTPQQFHDFLIVLNKEFTRKGVWKVCPDLKIMAAEDNNFNDRLLNAVYADPATKDLVQIAAGHQYEYGRWSMGNNLANLFTNKDRYAPNTFDASHKLGKQVWMSEWSTDAFGGTPAMTRGLVLAKVIHQDFTRSHLNAFVYWWSASLLHQGKPTKDLWAMAQYSQLVRPGWRVLNATASPASGVYVTAFADPASRKLAIVAVNTNTAARTITLNLSGASKIQTLNLYRTSATEDMTPVGSVQVNSTSQVLDLAPSSISTFYGEVRP
jgi:glucuronoarabinoxylan endo-1,4-beta-xylanase